ncbi:acyltransferase family protein [Bradyrhizobium tropiciagri]|uniref:acyltransferase family protein n=1 Tax=Bradyrhizobium tropiciagri TaxID=312253 RepID=UPI00067B4D00|nr:acyltransferase [Bradyrhizobium tropiciagri]
MRSSLQPDRSEPLDALRGLAIAMVISCHYFGFINAIFRYGVLGVDLFFVLSGFLIGGILLDSRKQPRYFSSFYGRRAFRILPLYWLLLAISPPDHWGYYLFFAQAVPWLQFGYPLQEPAFVTWSLAIEEQFYLFLPVLIFWLSRQWLIRALWSCILLAPVWRWLFATYLHDQSWEYLLPGRLDELLGGVLIACLMRGYCRSPATWAVLACLTAICDFAYFLAGAPFPLSCVALMCCVTVWSGAVAQQRVMLRPLIWMGRRCYALYLFHLVVLNAIFDSGFGIYSGLVALPIACILAETSWRAIEAPLIDYAKRRFAREEVLTSTQIARAT